MVEGPNLDELTDDELDELTAQMMCDETQARLKLDTWEVAAHETSEDIDRVMEGF